MSRISVQPKPQADQSTLLTRCRIHRQVAGTGTGAFSSTFISLLAAEGLPDRVVVEEDVDVEVVDVLPLTPEDDATIGVFPESWLSLSTMVTSDAHACAPVSDCDALALVCTIPVNFI